jgi:putative N6-adenine-specific DNA methylase
VLASDADGTILSIGRKNARNAGVADCVTFQQLPVGSFSSDEEFGCLVCNPPYGERVGKEGQLEELYSNLGQLYARLDGWSMFVLSAHPFFERFFGGRPDKKRKLYNGRIECCFYQYFGPLPRKAR